MPISATNCGVYVLLCSYRPHHRTPRNGWSLVSPNYFFFAPPFIGEVQSLTFSDGLLEWAYNTHLSVYKRFFFITQYFFNSTELKACLHVNFTDQRALTHISGFNKNVFSSKKVVQSLFSYHYNLYKITLLKKLISQTKL